jgi:hypothetical protein
MVNHFACQLLSVSIVSCKCTCLASPVPTQVQDGGARLQKSQKEFSEPSMLRDLVQQRCLKCAMKTVDREVGQVSNADLAII